MIQRVLELDGKRQNLSIGNLALESTVDALVDCTDVGKEDIEAIVREVRLQYETQLSPEQRRRKFIHDWGLKLAGAVVASLLVIAIYHWMGPEQPVNNVPVFPPRTASTMDTKMQRKFMTQAGLSSAVASLSALRPVISMYYNDTGRYPASLTDLGLDPAEMTDGNYIKSVELEKDGVIVAELADTFGKSKRLALVPGSSMGGLQTRWQCFTDVEASRFLDKQFSLCKARSKLGF